MDTYCNINCTNNYTHVDTNLHCQKKNYKKLKSLRRLCYIEVSILILCDISDIL